MALTQSLQFQYLSLHCLNLWPQFCFIPLTLHFRDCSVLFLPQNQLSRDNMTARKNTSCDFSQSWTCIPAAATQWLAVNWRRWQHLTAPGHGKRSTSHNSRGCWLALGSSILAPTSSFISIVLSSNNFLPFISSLPCLLSFSKTDRSYITVGPHNLLRGSGMMMGLKDK